MSAAVRHRESPSGLTSSYHTEEANCDYSPPAATSYSTAVTTSSIEALSPSLLSNLQRDYPTAYAALCVYEKAIRHHKERFQAKEAELLRCISVGEELLGQLDALKQRCETLAHERDAALASAETHSTPNLLNRERAAQRDAAEATRIAEEEERKRSQVHEAQCAHLREQLQDALQHTAIAQAERREVEATLHKTREQLHDAEERVRRVEEACQEREAAYAAQCNRDLQQQRSALQRQVSALQQQAELDCETVVAESTVELERLQRALVRAEKELEEHQRAAQRSSTALLLTESQGTAAVEMANLRRQIRQLEDINHDLQLQLRRQSAEMGESRLTAVQGDEKVGNGNAAGVSASPSTASTNSYPPTFSQLDDAAAVSASLTLQHRLQEQNAHLKDKLQSVSRQAQAEMDKAHEARLDLQRHVASLEAQLLLLRTSVVGGLEEELQRTRENTDAAEAHGRELQEIADALDTRANALHRELTQTAASLDAERQTSGHLREELRAAQDAVDAARQDTDAVMEDVARKESLIAQQQRERQQLITALRTLQAETANIEGALTEMSVRHEEGVVSGEMNVARLQERCVLLEHEVEAAQEERLTLCGRLRDAEEAVAVLTDAQRVSQEAVRDAQRRASEAAERAGVSTEQLRGQQQQWAARATAAEEEVVRLRRQLRDVTQRLRDGEAEMLRRDDALRHSQEKASAVSKEMRQLREQQEKRESTSREQWRQQYAQNTADRENIIHGKEQMIQELSAELQGLRKAAAQRGKEAQQLQLQRQQAQSALSEAVTNMASYKGRLQALEEELKRVERERAEAKAEVQRLATQRRERSAEGESGENSSPTARAITTQRVSELESKLSSCEEALRAADAQRLQAQTALLQLVLPPSSSPSDATPTALSNTHRWDDVVAVLDAGIRDLSLAAAASLSAAPSPPHNPQREESSDEVDGTMSRSTLDAALPDACQRASAAMLRAARDWIEFLHDEDERRWSTLKQTALTLFAAHDAASAVPRAQEAVRSPRRGGTTALHSAEELHDRFIAAQQAFAASMEEVRRGWTMAVAERNSHGAQQRKEREEARVAELNSLLEGKEKDCAALQRTIDELLQQQAETAQKQTSFEQTADQLRADVAARDARLAELERRLDTRTTAAQAEREEWLAKWRESQRHRSKEREDHEAALLALRKELAAAEDAAAVAVDTHHRNAEETQRQLRTQLQELQNTAAAAEASLHQQVHALTQDKAQATQALRRVRAVVTELEERVRAAEEAVRTKEEHLTAAQAAMEELRRAHHQTLANGAAAETFGQETLTQQVASLRSQLSTSRQDYELMEKTHAAERAELQALRRVNASLETRLAEVEEDRAPLRQQLHSLLAFADE